MGEQIEYPLFQKSRGRIGFELSPEQRRTLAFLMDGGKPPAGIDLDLLGFVNPSQITSYDCAKLKTFLPEIFGMMMAEKFLSKF